MGIVQLGKLALNYTKTLGKQSILQTKPQIMTKLDTVGLKYAHKLEGDVVQFSKLSKLKNEILEICKPSSKNSNITNLLDTNALNIIEKYINLDAGTTELVRFLDVIKRRNYDLESIGKVLGKNTQLSEKLIHTLEFKNFDKVKDITLETFDKLSLKERKVFINSFISIKLGGTKKQIDQLPDMKIFENVKKKVFPTLPKDMLNKIENKKYTNELKKCKEEVEKEYSEILKTLLQKIPRGKDNIPNIPLKIKPGRFLDVKPPLTNSVNSIVTNTEIVGKHKINIGTLPKEGKYMIHNLEESNLSRLEAYILTDSDAILCTGYKGGIGYLKGSDRIGVILSPKSIKDLIIQAPQDMSSGYGATKNLSNIQDAFLHHNNSVNSYVPDLIRQKLNITIEEYNARIAKLKNVHYIEDIKNIDDELYKAVCNVTSKEKMFEGIMRPNLEAIYLPDKKCLTENIAEFAEKYNLKVLIAQN